MNDNTLGIWLVNPINSLYRALFLYPFLTSFEELYTEFVVLLTTLLIFKIEYKMAVIEELAVIENGRSQK